MECSLERSAQLMEYAEGSLPPAEVVELEMHLSSCASCRRELESWRRLEGQLRDFPLVAEPRGFTAAVMSRVAQPSPAASAGYRPADPVAALALGALLLGIGALLSGVSGWEWQFDLSYLVEIAWQFAGTASAVVIGIAGQLLAGIARAVYAGLTDAAPVLMAALLLALFALGPSEIMSAVTARSRES